MGLHKIEEHEAKKFKCEICKTPAVWYDDNFTINTKAGHNIQVGTNRGLVYATCDHCKKVICGPHNKRGKFQSRLKVTRNFLPGAYKGSKECMQEAHYINHMGNPTTIICCKDFKCVKHFEDDLRQKRLKEMQVS